MCACVRVCVCVCVRVCVFWGVCRGSGHCSVWGLAWIFLLLHIAAQAACLHVCAFNNMAKRAATPQSHPKAPSVQQPGWTNMGPFKIGPGTLDRPDVDALWQRTGCVCKSKVFKDWRGRELCCWGPPPLLSGAWSEAVKVIQESVGKAAQSQRPHRMR